MVAQCKPLVSVGNNQVRLGAPHYLAGRSLSLELRVRGGGGV